MAEDKKKVNKKIDEIRAIVGKYYRYILLFFVLAILIFGYFSVIKPKFETTLAMIKISFEDQRQKFLKQKAVLDDLEAKIVEYESVEKKDHEVMDYILPEKYPKEILFSEMEQLARANGVVLTNLAVVDKGDLDLAARKLRMATQKETKENKVDSRIGIYQLNINLSGLDYAGFKKILAAFENNMRLMDIESVDYNPSASTVVMTINTYYQKNDEEKKS